MNDCNCRQSARASPRLIWRLLGAVLLAAGAAGGHALTELERAAEAGDLETLRRLLDAGAELEQVDPNSVWRRTALLAAARIGQLDSLQLLLERGADVDAVDAGGATALRVAVREGREKAVQALLAGGAKVDADRNEFGWTPLVWAVREAGNRPAAMRPRYVAIVGLLTEASAACPAQIWLPMERRAISLSQAAAELGEAMKKAVAKVCQQKGE